MATMREELTDMIKKLNEVEVEEAFNFVQKMLDAHTEENEEEAQKRRDEAFEWLTAWIEEHKDTWGDDFDWRKEYIKGLEEKYGITA